MRLSQFKIKLTKHLWSIALSDNEQPEHKWSFQSSDDDIVKLDSIKIVLFFSALKQVLQILVWGSGGH